MAQGFVLFLFIIIPLVLLLALFSFEIKTFLVKKNYKLIIYKKLYNYSVEVDHLLLNDVHLLLSNDDVVSSIDHIFFADKYIYVIKDVYFDGILYGNPSDPYLFNYTSDDKKIKVENPLFVNNKIVNNLMEKIDPTKKDNTIVNVVCYNKNLIVPNNMNIKEQGIFFIPYNELVGTIRQAEKDQITPISHQKSEKLANLLKEKSEMIKAEEKAIYEQKKKI